MTVDYLVEVCTGLSAGLAAQYVVDQESRLSKLSDEIG
jgi:hypothetical protein